MGVKMHSNRASDDKTVEICTETQRRFIRIVAIETPGGNRKSFLSLNCVLLVSLTFAGNLNMKGISFFTHAVLTTPFSIVFNQLWEYLFIISHEAKRG